jgi:hypothetical protein
MVHKFKIRRVIVAGGREFLNYELLKRKLRAVFANWIKQGDRIEIVSGTARGADQLGERFAKEHGYTVKYFPANWRPNGVYDPAAGFKRNEQMAEHANYLVAFWDGKSRGTAHMIRTAEKAELQVRIIHY